MLDQGIKMSMRNFKPSPPVTTQSPHHGKESHEIINNTISILNCVLEKFSKRQCAISVELEEMKKEMTSTVKSITNFLCSLKDKQVTPNKFISFASPERHQKVKVYRKTYNQLYHSPTANNSERVVSKDKIRSYFNGSKSLSNLEPKKVLNKRSDFTNSTNKSSFNRSLQSPNKSSKTILANTGQNFSKNKLSYMQSKKENHINQNNKKKYNNEFKEKKSIYFSNSKVKALYHLAQSSITPISEKIKIYYLNKELKAQLPRNDLSIQIEKKISNIKKQLQHDKYNEVKRVIEERNKVDIHYPSKTAQSKLQFLNKKQEDNFYNDTNTEHTLLLYNIIYILCFDCQDETIINSNIKEHFEKLYSSFQVDNIKSLFTKVIYNKIFLNISESNSIYSLIQNEELTEMVVNLIKQFNDKKDNLNNGLSLLSFILNEIADQLELYLLNESIVSYLQLQKEEEFYYYLLSTLKKANQM